MLSDYWEGLVLSRKLYQEVLESVCESFGLTRNELDILLFLANNPKYDTATDLVEKRKMTKSHVSVSVGMLRERGLLEASMEDGNRKTIHLKLLPDSREAVEAGRIAQKDFFELIFRSFSTEERNSMGVLFRRISENARAALREDF